MMLIKGALRKQMPNDRGHCMDCCGRWSCITLNAEQDALQRDADALSAERLSCITGPQLQQLLARPEQLPAQDLRAELLREASPGAC